MNIFKSLFKPRNFEPDPDEEDAIEDERELGSVNKGLARQNRIVNWLGAIGACVLAAFFLYKYYAGVYEDRQRSKVASKDLSRTVATTSLPPLTMPETGGEQAPAATGAANVPPPPMQAPGSPTGAPPASGQPPAKSLSQLARERRLKREVRFNFDGSLAGSAATVGMGSQAAIVSSSETAGERHGSPAASAAVQGTLSRTGMEMARAYLLPDPTLMMTRGKLIRCTVLPAFDTTLTGPVTCVTGEDATGADNKVSLMDRGTICFGQQGGGITHGQRRIGIIWQRCETPQHALVPFDSGATDPLGRPGIPGTVDNHFWDRFGGAIALSLITDVGPYLIATRQRGDNNTTVSFPSMSGPKDVLSEVVKSTVDIAPTITGPQGAEVFIYLAHDIDFRDIYQLERVR
jgi:type IV secretion system protein VirB10